ncbi:hypothetical protein EYF80_024328 [Liparis tanakae]|uniref:Uncharacterized protein n=1 Tax=Liparis tanakae TaxID=230148 RepID=A0A4Z2HHX3_9TELE|nr:hypothetical protein EYF80_024328 [Liparis tanakae]
MGTASASGREGERARERERERERWRDEVSARLAGWLTVDLRHWAGRRGSSGSEQRHAVSVCIPPRDLHPPLHPSTTLTPPARRAYEGTDIQALCGRLRVLLCLSLLAGPASSLQPRVSRRLTASSLTASSLTASSLTASSPTASSLTASSLQPRVSRRQPHSIQPHSIQPHSIQPHSIQPHSIQPPAPSQPRGGIDSHRPVPGGIDAAASWLHNHTSLLLSDIRRANEHTVNSARDESGGDAVSSR